MVALEEAFKGSLMVGKMPACVLHLRMAYGSVDVNVHPAKIEVRFLNERPIFDAVYHGVKTALNQWDSPHVMKLERPAQAPFPKTRTVEQLPLRTEQPVPQKAVETEHAVQEPDATPKPEAPSLPIKPAEPLPGLSVNDSGAPAGLTRTFGADMRFADVAGPEDEEWAAVEALPQKQPEAVKEEQPVPAEQAPTETLLPKQERPPARLVGEAFGTYILLERGDELVLIDKHAAHERMLYEELKANRGTAAHQMLLEPVTVTLEKNEYAAVLNALDLFEQAGFELEDFGAGTVLVRSAPLILGGEDIADAVMEMAGYLANSKNDLTTERLNWLYHPEELLALADRLEQNSQIRYCPHGRPVSILLKKRDLEKQFGRV